MLVLPTAEVRWFFTEPPFRLERYFDPSHEAPSRVDWYALPSEDGCGIKFREGRLETKLRNQTIGPRNFSHILGSCEQWTKWSCEMPGGSTPPEDLLRATNWLEVAKRRHVRFFEVTRSTVMESPSRPLHGGSFEITYLRIGDLDYATVGFEATGLEGDLEFNLSQVVHQVNNENALPGSLRLECSSGYPAWLNRLPNA